MSKKKSIWEALRLVESTEEEFDQEAVLASLQTQASQIEETAQPEVHFEFAQDEDFLTISEVYEKAGISDLEHSIFKVDEFSKHLPDNLPTDVKRQSVIGILSASGLELDTLLDDAEKRINALKGVATLTFEKSNDVIMEKEGEITDLLNRVDSLKQFIIDRKAAQEQQNSIIDNELDKITQILKFINTTK